MNKQQIKKEIKIGSIVWCKDTEYRNAKKAKDIEDAISEWKVVKIGTKYITLRPTSIEDTYSYADIKVSIETFCEYREGYAPNYQMYLNKDDIFTEHHFKQAVKDAATMLEKYAYIQIENFESYDAFAQTMKEKYNIILGFLDEIKK